jgi:hypothetical protein
MTEEEIKQMDAQIIEGFEEMFGSDPIKALENAYSMKPESVGMSKEGYYFVVYEFTKSQLRWILEALKWYETLKARVG